MKTLLHVALKNYGQVYNLKNVGQTPNQTFIRSVATYFTWNRHVIHVEFTLYCDNFLLPFQQYGNKICFNFFTTGK